MRWSSIMSLPGFERTRAVKVADASREYASVARFGSGGPLVAGTVYFASEATALSGWQLPEDTAFFVLDDGDVEASDFAGSQAGIALFASPDAFEECFSGLVSEFEETRRLQAGIRGLARQLARGSALSDVANAIARLYHASVSIVDISFTQLAVSDDYSANIPEFGDDLDQGRVSTRAFEALRKASLLDAQVPTGKTRTFETPLDGGERIVNYYTPILMNQMVMGSFSLITKGAPIPKPRLDLLPGIADLLSLALRRGTGPQSVRRQVYADLFAELTSSDAPRSSERDLNERFSLFGFELKRYKLVQYYDLGSSLITAEETAVLASQLCERSKLSALSYVGADFIILLKTADATIAPFRVERAIAEIRRRAGNDDPAIRVGISDWFTEISHMKRHVDQARRCISLGRAFDPGKPAYRYERFRTYDLLGHLSQDASLDDYVYPPLLGLLDYDQKHGTQFSQTLYLHLRNPGHPARTCQELGIHRNTLYQRLERVDALMGESWREPEAIEQIRLGFKVLEYRGLFDA